MEQLKPFIKNPNFTKEFSEQFDGLVLMTINFIKDVIKQPDEEVKKFITALENLRIVNHPAVNAPLIKYNSKTNEMQIRATAATEKGIDVHYLVAVELFRILNSNEKIKALVIGNAAGIVANNITPNDGEPVYEDQQIITNLLARVLTGNVVLRLCFNDDVALLNKTLMEKNIHPEIFNEFLEMTSYLHENVNRDNREILDKLQTLLIDMFVLSDHNQKETNDLDVYIFGDKARQHYRDKTASTLSVTEEVEQQYKRAA